MRLVVVVPVYGNWTDTVGCIRALLAQTTSDFQVLIADDGSPTPPPAELTSLDRVQFLVGENLGFAGNCNRAAEAAISEGATHLLFLNNDTQFSSVFVEGWLRVLAERPALAGRVYVLDQGQRALRAAVEAAIWSFGESADGKRYLEKNKLEGYRKLKRGELEAMEPFADEVRRNLGLK